MDLLKPKSYECQTSEKKDEGNGAIQVEAHVWDRNELIKNLKQQ